MGRRKGKEKGKERRKERERKERERKEKIEREKRESTIIGLRKVIHSRSSLQAGLGVSCTVCKRAKPHVNVVGRTVDSIYEIRNDARV